MKTASGIIFSVERDFVTWLNEELNRRGWSSSELHRRSGMATSTISMVLGGQNKPGWDFCNAVAQALGESPEKVFRLAGLLPPLPAPDDPILQELNDVTKNLSPEDRQEVLDFAKFKHRQQQEKKQQRQDKKKK